MSLLTLILRSISGSSFRSTVVILCAALVSGLALSTTLIVQGAQGSLRLGLERLGADIVVVPEGAETKVESALLMGRPTAAWMPGRNVRKIASIPGVAVASPQLYLTSLTNASCCSASDMFVVAFDPQTDFTVTPWLERNLGRPLNLGEAIGGYLVYVPAEEDYIKLYGSDITLRGNLESTGTGLDQTLFLTFQTAQDVARLSWTRAEKPLEIPPDSVSAIMIRVAPGADRDLVTLDIAQSVPGVSPIQSPRMFESYREQMTGLRQGILAILAITWVLSVVFVGLLFSSAVNERRRELGVLRALGCTRRHLLQVILGEACLLAVAGGALGIAFFGLAVYLFHDLIAMLSRVHFLLPSVPGLLAMVGGGLVLALASVALGALYPALQVSFQDPAIAMRE